MNINLHASFSFYFLCAWGLSEIILYICLVFYEIILYIVSQA